MSRETNLRTCRPGKPSWCLFCQTLAVRVRRLGLGLGFAATLAFPSLLPAQPSSPKDSSARILVFNSYHVGYFWTDMVVQGIQSVLREVPQAEVHIEFMDARRYFLPEDMDRVYRFYREKFRNLTFDIIISSDDAALEFLLQHHGEFFPRTPVVFCGVHRLDRYDFTNRPRFTGLVEVTEEETNIALALRLHPTARRVVVITDQKDTLAAAREGNSKVQKAFPAIEFVFLDPEETMFSDLLDRLSRIPADSVGLLGAVFRDRSFQSMTAERSTREITSHSPFPNCGTARQGASDSGLGLALTALGPRQAGP